MNQPNLKKVSMTNKKIYLDTFVISCLQVPETPERMADTYVYGRI